MEVIFTKISAAVNVQSQIGGSVFKGIANGLSSALSPAKALLATTGKFAIAIAAVYALYKAAYNFVNAGEIANSKMEDAISSYSDAKSQVEDTNNELKTTQDRMNSLQSKGSLTLVEQDELDKLKETNRQLLIKKDLDEKNAITKAKETAASVEEAVSKNYYNIPTSTEMVGEYKGLLDNFGWNKAGNKYWDESNLTGQLAYIQHLKELQDEVEYGTDSWNEYQKKIDSTTDSLWNAVSAMEKDKSTLQDLPKEALSDSNLDLISMLSDSIETIYKQLDPAKWKQIKLDNFLAGSDISSEKEDLLTLAKKNKYNGGIKASDLSSRFQEAADKAGLAEVLGNDYIQTIVDQINAEAGVVDVNKLRLQIFNKAGRAITGNNKTSKEFSDWIDSMSPEDTELVYKLSLDADSANWTLEQWQQKLADLKSGADVAIADFQTKVTDAIDVQNKLVSAFAAGNSATGMTNEQIKEVCNSFKELDGFEIDKLFERTATGVQMNAEAFENFNKQIQNQNLIELYTALEAKQNKYNEAVKSGSEANKKSYMSDIQQLQLLINELEAATSKYNAFVTASSSANRRDSFSNVAAGYKSVKTLLDQGWVSDDSVTSYLDLLLGDGWEAKTEGDAKKAFRLISDSAQSEAGKVTGHSLQSYMTTDGSGNLTSQGAWTFAEDLVNLQNKGMFKDLEGSVAYKGEGDILHLDLTGKNLDTVAEKLGTTTDMVELLGKALSDAGMDVKFSSAADKISTARDELNKLEEEQKTLQQGTQEWADNQSKIATQNKIIANVTVEEAISGGTTLEELDAMDGKTIQETFDLNADQAQAVMDNIDARIQEAKDAEITVKIDEGQLSQLMGLDSLNVNVNPKVEKAPDIPEGTMKVKAVVTNNPPSISDGTMNVHANVTSTSTSNGSSPGGKAAGSKASGTMLSVAKADGTAYNVLNYKRLSPSHAGGNVALLSDENALTNEVGQESLIRNGEWFLLPPGPHMEHLKKGDIIFNAKQTHDLLNAGKTNSYAKSYALGTQNKHTMVTFGGGSGGYSGSGKNPWKGQSGSGSGSGGGGSSNSGSSSSSSKNDKIDWPEIAIKRIESLITKLTNIVSSSFKKVETKLTASNSAIENTMKQIEAEQNAYNTYMREANKVGLAESLAVQVRDGNVYHIGSYDEDDTKKIQEYQKWYEKALECKSAVDDLHESLAELYKGQFDNIQKDFENQLSVLESSAKKTESSISKIEAQGYMVTSKYYETQKQEQSDTIDLLKKQLVSMQGAFKKAMDSGEIEEGSDAYYEMVSSIEDVKDKIQDAELEIINLNNSLRELDWNAFDMMLERIERVNDEAEFMIDLLTDAKLYDKDGNMTDNGMAALGLRMQRYNTYLAESEKYAKEIQAIEAEIAKDPYNENLTNRKKDLIDAQRESIKSAISEKDAIKDLIDEGIQSEIDHLNELISAYEEQLDSVRDLYDYQKKLKDQTSEIASLEKQLAAYANDTSAETKAKVQKLQVDLENAQENLRDTQYDRYVSDQKKLLSDMVDEYQKAMDERLDDVNGLITELTGSVNDNAGKIYDTIKAIADQYGYTTSDELNGVWNSGDKVAVGYGDKVTGSLSSIDTMVSSIGKDIATMIQQLNALAGTNLTASHSYATGKRRISASEFAWTQENGIPETIIRPSDGALLTSLKVNDSVLNGAATSNLWNMANDPSGFIYSHLARAYSPSVSLDGNTNVENRINLDNLNINLPNVTNYEEFIAAAKGDKRFERLVQAVTIDRIAGKSSFRKYST